MKNRVAFLLGIANSKISTKLFIAFYFGDMLGRIACLAMAVVAKILHCHIFFMLMLHNYEFNKATFNLTFS